nr:hypothetical protein [Tanacetum cinerariifolium]
MERNPDSCKGVRDLTFDEVFDIKKQDDITASNAQETEKGTSSTAAATTTQVMEKPATDEKGKEQLTAEQENQAEKIIGHSCTELVAKYTTADPKKIPTEILNTPGKSAIFQVHLNILGNIRDLTFDEVFDIKKQDDITASNAQETEKGTSSTAAATTTQVMEKPATDEKGKEQLTAEQENQETPPSTHVAITELLNWKTSIVSFVLLSRKEELNMSTVKKKVRILDWFTPIQKKAKTQDGFFSTPEPLTDPLPEDTETQTRKDKTNDTEKENDFNVSAIPHDPGLRINMFDYNPNDQDATDDELTEKELKQIEADDQ